MLDSNYSEMKKNLFLPSNLSEINHSPSACILSIGEELLRGAYVNKNATTFSLKLVEAGYQVVFHISCGDQTDAINHALQFCVNNAELIIVCGGLGPTSDDVTRQAVARYLGVSLVENHEEWQKIIERLQRFDIPVDESNRRQTLFPFGAEIISNPNGTAAGFASKYKEKIICALPGPSHECLPMLEKFLLLKTYSNKQIVLHWRLMNVSESIIAAKTDLMTAAIRPHIQLSYLVHYPYVDIRLAVNKKWAECTALYKTVCNNISAEFSPFLVAREIVSASQLVRNRQIFPSEIIDDVTEGAIEKYLFQDNKNGNRSAFKLFIRSNGNLSPPFQGKILVKCDIEKVKVKKIDHYEISISKRGNEIVKAIIEFVAWCILRSFSSDD